MSLERLVSTLLDGGVEFVLVGGVASILHGAAETTVDVDIVHERSAGNLERLQAVLEGLEARYREHLPKTLRPTVEHLASDGHHLLATRLGPLDLLGRIGGDLGYEQLAPSAEWFELDGGRRVRTISLEDLIRSKEAVDRPKDRVHLPILRAILRERG